MASTSLYVTYLGKEGPFLRLWGQLDKNMPLAIDKALLDSTKNFNDGHCIPATVQFYEIGGLCCAKFTDDAYYRARITDTTLLIKGFVEVMFIDYGNKDIVQCKNIRTMAPFSNEFITIPPQAREFFVANITHCGVAWEQAVLEKIMQDIRYLDLEIKNAVQIGPYYLINLFLDGQDISTILRDKGYGTEVPVHIQQTLIQKTLQQRSMQEPQMRVLQQQRYTMPPPLCVPSQPNYQLATASMHSSQQSPSMHINNIAAPPPLRSPESPHSLKNPTILTYKAIPLETGSQHAIYVSYVTDGPCLFSVQLKKSEETLKQLMTELNEIAVQPFRENPLPGTMCLSRSAEDDFICRAVVTNMVDGDYKVFYVDFGNTELRSIDNLFQIPAKYIIPKLMATRFALDGLEQAVVSIQMKCAFKEFVEDRVLNIKVNSKSTKTALSLCDIWDERGIHALDVVKHVALEAYPDPVTVTKGLCKEVRVSYVFSCNRFYIQLKSKATELSELMTWLQKVCGAKHPIETGSLVTRMPCSALFEGDGLWYRATILELYTDSAKVMYVDFGNEEVVVYENVRSAHYEQMTMLRPQAIQCCLNGYQNMPPDTERDEILEELLLEQDFTLKVIEIQGCTALVDLIDGNNYNIASILLDRIATSRSQISPLLIQDSHKIELKKRTPPQHEKKPYGKNAREENATFWNNGDRRGNSREQDDNRFDNPRNRNRNDRDDGGNPPRKYDNTRRDGSGSERSFDGGKSGSSPRGAGGDRANNSRPPRFQRENNNAGGFDRRQNNNSWENNTSPPKRGNAATAATGDSWEEPQQTSGNWRNKDNDDGGSNRREGFNRKENNGEGFKRRENNTDGGFNRRDNNTDGFNRRENNTDGSNRRDNNDGANRRDGFNRKEKDGDGFNRHDNTGGGDEKRGRNSERTTAKEYKPPVGKYSKDTDFSGDFTSNKAANKSWESAPVVEEVFDLAEEGAQFVVADLSGKVEDIGICWFHNPGNFFVQLENTMNELKTLMEDLQKLYKNRPAMASPKVGASVIALYPSDRAYYRATILESAGNKHRVQYVDFGNSSFATKICAIEKKHMTLPAQAACCQLYGIGPVGETWPSAGKLQKHFDKNVFSCQFCSYAENKYVVVLTSGQDNIGDQLIQDNLAISLEPIAAVVELALLPKQKLKVYVSAVTSLGDFSVEVEPGVAVNCALSKLADATETFVEKLQSLTGQFVIAQFEDIVEERAIVTLYDLTGTKLPLTTPTSPTTIPPLYTLPITSSTQHGYISHTTPTTTIYLQPSTYADYITSLLTQLYEHYSALPPMPTPLTPITGLLCVTLSSDGNYYRAVVVGVTSDEVTVRYIDYGNEEVVGVEALRELDVGAWGEMGALALELTVSGAVEALVDREVTVRWVEGVWMVVEEVEEVKGVGVVVGQAEVAEVEEPAAVQTVETEIVTEIVPVGVSVVISHIDTPGQFYLQQSTDLEHIDTLQAQLQEQIPELADIETATAGILCAALYSANQEWYRAQVLDADADITTVRFVDYGNTDVLNNTSTTRIKTLPAELLTCEQYARRCSLHLAPVPSAGCEDDEWSPEACTRFETLCTPATENGDEIWAEIIHQDEKSTYVRLGVDGVDVSEVLVTEKYGTELSGELVNAGGQQTGFISHVNSPSEFWVQLENACGDLELIADQLQAGAEEYKELGDKSPGTLCAAVFPDDESWYRARILSNTVAGLEVLFIDYGNSCTCTHLRELPEDIVMLPPMAQKCCLQKPSGVLQWSPVACDKFKEIAADGRTVFTVLNLQPAETTVVQLFFEDCDIIEQLQPITYEGGISQFDDIDHFWVQKLADFDRIESLAAQLLDNSEKCIEMKREDVTVGLSLVGAISEEDGAWYRVKVLELLEADKYKVLCVDYGCTTETSKIHELSEEFRSNELVEPLAKQYKLLPLPGYKWSADSSEKLREINAAGETVYFIEDIAEDVVQLYYEGHDVRSLLEPVKCTPVSSVQNTPKKIVKLPELSDVTEVEKLEGEAIKQEETALEIVSRITSEITSEISSEIASEITSEIVSEIEKERVEDSKPVLKESETSADLKEERNKDEKEVSVGELENASELIENEQETDNKSEDLIKEDIAERKVDIEDSVDIVIELAKENGDDNKLEDLVEKVSVEISETDNKKSEEFVEKEASADINIVDNKTSECNADKNTETSEKVTENVMEVTSVLTEEILENDKFEKIVKKVTINSNEENYGNTDDTVVINSDDEVSSIIKDENSVEKTDLATNIVEDIVSTSVDKSHKTIGSDLVNEMVKNATNPCSDVVESVKEKVVKVPVEEKNEAKENSTAIINDIINELKDDTITSINGAGDTAPIEKVSST